MEGFLDAASSEMGTLIQVNTVFLFFFCFLFLVCFVVFASNYFRGVRGVCLVPVG